LGLTDNEAKCELICEDAEAVQKIQEAATGVVKMYAVKMLCSWHSGMAHVSMPF